ncbi:MAG: hypothetical protein QOE54_6559 [Streptosporangiaceae bacterium]|jgi:hypothetical protein|nr:hypothetical protein [Streptosporangiaceae bacterium]
MDQPRNDSPASPHSGPAARSPATCAIGRDETFATSPWGFDDGTGPARAATVPEGFLALLEAMALACTPGSTRPGSTTPEPTTPGID